MLLECQADFYKKNPTYYNIRFEYVRKIFLWKFQIENSHYAKDDNKNPTDKADNLTRF